MNEMIGGYRCLTPMRTTGSGSARWCIASRGLERFFLKEFLSPVYPAQPTTPLGQRQLERCRQFEHRKQQLYAAVSCVIGDVVVPVIDFFRSGSHYYAVSEALPDHSITAQEAYQLLNESEKRKLLYDLAVCLQRLHTQGIVHADLKPEHVMLIREPIGWRMRLIDLDSGFLTDDPPEAGREIEGDPAYLSPEAFLRMVGEQAALSPAQDIFAFGLLIHQIWTGRLPEFDRSRWHYAYEAAMDKGDIQLELPEEWTEMVEQMLHANPEERPHDRAIAERFAPPRTAGSSIAARNGLSRLMKG